MGEVPTITTTFLVSGSTLQDVLEGPEVIDADRNDGIARGEQRRLHAALLHRGKHHRRAGKKVRTMALHEGGCGRADADDEVERAFGMERAKVFDERRLIFVARSRGQQRVVRDVERPPGLPLQFGADGSRIFVPRLEVRTERMQHHDPL
jgi:hypothetical protein